MFVTEVRFETNSRVVTGTPFTRREPLLQEGDVLMLQSDLVAIDGARLDKSSKMVLVQRTWDTYEENGWICTAGNWRIFHKKIPDTSSKEAIWSSIERLYAHDILTLVGHVDLKATYVTLE